MTVEGVPLSYYMEEMLTSKISMNAGKGRQGLEWVINKINTEVSGAVDGEEKEEKFDYQFKSTFRSKESLNRQPRARTSFCRIRKSRWTISRDTRARTWTT